MFEMFDWDQRKCKPAFREADQSPQISTLIEKEIIATYCYRRWCIRSLSYSTRCMHLLIVVVIVRCKKCMQEETSWKRLFSFLLILSGKFTKYKMGLNYGSLISV